MLRNGLRNKNNYFFKWEKNVKIGMNFQKNSMENQEKFAIENIKNFFEKKQNGQKKTNN